MLVEKSYTFVTILLLCCWYIGGTDASAQEKAATGASIKLPPPILDGTLSCREGAGGKALGQGLQA